MVKFQMCPTEHEKCLKAHVTCPLLSRYPTRNLPLPILPHRKVHVVLSVERPFWEGRGIQPGAVWGHPWGQPNHYATGTMWTMVKSVG
jgi:hypothetical protein